MDKQNPHSPAEPKLPRDPNYYDPVVVNFRRYQRVVWKVSEDDMFLRFGQSDGIKGVKNNYLLVARDGRQQTFLGGNHKEDPDSKTYEDGNLTRPYSIHEVIDIWLRLIADAKNKKTG